MLPSRSTSRSVLHCCGALGQERKREAKQTVKSEFLEHAGVQHRRRRGGGGVRLRSPGVKGEKRNENAEADQEQQIDVALRLRGDHPERGRFLQCAEVKAARSLRHAAVKHDQAKQKNETPGREIDRDFPGGGLPIAAAPDSDEEKSRDERQLVEGVEEKEIERSECAHGAAGNEEKAGVKRIFVLGDFAREPDGRERHDRGQQHHHQAQAIEPEGEIDPPIAADRAGGDELKSALAGFECEISQQRSPRGSTRRPRARCAGPARRPGWRARRQSDRKTMKSRITGKA